MFRTGLPCEARGLAATIQPRTAIKSESTLTVTELDAQNTGPLVGIRVLDFSRLAPGPYCAMLLGDLGADVVRIDAPVAPVRTYQMLARNKRSLVLDLKTEAGRGVMHRLVESADVVLEGNRPGVMARLEADYATLFGINPRIIYCSLTGFGQEGPMAQAAGHDINYIALAGVLSQMQRGAHGTPSPPLNLVADYGGGGLLAALGITSALYEREQSGVGQFIDAAMIDGSASLMAAHYSTQGELSKVDGLLGGGAPFYRCYETSDGRFMAVGAIETKFFDALCEATGLKLQSQQMNQEEWPRQQAMFEEVFRSKTRAQWTVIFDEVDACTSPVLDLDEAPEHPHNVERNGFLIGPDDQLHVAPAPRFSRTPGRIRSAAPKPGSDTNAILKEAGLEQPAIDQLAQTGAFGPNP